MGVSTKHDPNHNDTLFLALQATSETAGYMSRGITQEVGVFVRATMPLPPLLLPAAPAAAASASVIE